MSATDPPKRQKYVSRSFIGVDILYFPLRPPYAFYSESLLRTHFFTGWAHAKYPTMTNSHLGSRAAILTIIMTVVWFFSVPVSAATRYVDSAATGANNGTSWSNAWTSLPTSGVFPGDTVYISGGPTGSTKTYNRSSFWNPPSGAVGSRITYQIGQEPEHNGIAIFNLTLMPPGNNPWVSGPRHINVIGDASDGIPHFKLTNYRAAASNVSDIRIAYVDASSGLTVFGDFNPANNLEIDHCIITINDMASDHASFASLRGATYTDNSIHDCTIRIPSVGPGIGADGLQWNGTGFSIYNNLIIGYVAPYVGGQHQDGWQATSGSKIKIFNNVFVDVGNYAIFAEAFSNGFSDLFLYNNIVLVTNPAIPASRASAAVIVGTSGGYFGPLPATFQNVVIANNIAVDFGIIGQVSFSLNNVTAKPTTFTNCFVVNNISLNSTGVGTQGNATSTVANNIAISKPAGTFNFMAYTEFGGLGNNLHLKPEAATLIGTGTNLSSFFTIDKNGMLRPSSGPWDIGPYILGSSPTPTPPSNAQTSILLE